MNMSINPEYLGKLKECNLDTVKGIMFGFLITYNKDFKGLQEFILDDDEGKKALFPYNEFQRYSINLCKLNVATSQNELVIPLFGNEVQVSLFNDFINLLSVRGVNNKGHLNNPTDFNIFSSEDVKAFEKTFEMIKDCDINRLVDTVVLYYKETPYKSKLCNFLGTSNVVSAYKNI